MIDEETKNGLIRRGREQARACFAETIKKVRLISLHLSELCVHAVIITVSRYAITYSVLL